PNLNRYYEKYKGQVEVVGINLQENPNQVKSFIASRGISFPIALDPAGIAAADYGVRYTNTHFLIDKQGNIIREIPGDIRESDIQWLIQNG
ncbi:MAG: TlpA family protein disulfide reductase, partial [Candidatus Paceibacteria bacterium]